MDLGLGRIPQVVSGGCGNGWNIPHRQGRATLAKHAEVSEGGQVGFGVGTVGGIGRVW